MSLVNLSYVCSHLQNASLARLGLTSIPYTRLHLSLSLLLQKQGFLSQVKLGGPSPPASCFPPGMRDNHHVTSHPHTHNASESTFTEEHALQRIVRDKTGTIDAERLREEGFGEEAVEFALTHREKTKSQLERDGWDEVAADFFVKHSDKPPAQLEAAGLEPEAVDLLQRNTPMLEECRAEVQRWSQDKSAAQLREQLHTSLLRHGFNVPTLQYFAVQDNPRNIFISARELAHDGLTLSNQYTLGLSIPNQPFTPPPPPQFADPDGLEAEGVVTQANRASRRLWLGLKYWDGMPVLSKARLVSKPTKRMWLGHRELGQLVRGTSSGPGREVKPLTKIGEIMAVSTDRGLMEVRECVERKVGGLVLCRIW